MATPGLIKIRTRGKGSAITVLQQTSTSTSQPSVAPAAAPAPAPPPPAPKLKIVIRHLPASMTEQEYNVLTADVINKDTVEWSSFTPGKVPQDRNKPTTFSIAHARARSTETLIQIKAGLNGKPLTDSRGQEYTVQVEFAPFQKFPQQKGRLRHDARSGTIDNDPDFISFLENLKHTGPNASSLAAKTEGDADKSKEKETKVYKDPLAAPVPSYEAPIMEPGSKVTTTPLVEFIKQQKLAPKIKEKGKGKAAVLAAEEDDAKSTTSSGGGKKRERDRKRRREKEKEREKEREKEKVSQQAAGLSGDKSKKVDKKSSNSTPASAAASAPATTSGKPSTEPPARPARRERGNAGLSAAAILQRDLGLTTSGRGRRNRGTESTSEKPATASSATTTVTSPSSNATASTNSQSTPPAQPSHGNPSARTACSSASSS
ncbi:hypothetical protein TWF788_007195 [Orbilia oligospora]|uniref:UPF3 domain-containing protein n=1 Tax=Orbilia oligospora TaxID=2813651 RepID=A0A7C8Q3Q7_ORBOL|nr:hypothetical protein TWF788_007195 [Orbilia oligospora]